MRNGRRRATRALVLALALIPAPAVLAAEPSGGSTTSTFEHAHALAFDAGGRALWLGGLDVHGIAIDPNTPAKLHILVRGNGEGVYRTTDGELKWVRVDDGPAGETKVLASGNIPTGMGGIFLYAGTAEGLQRNPDCF